MTIEVLYFDGCPSYEQLLDHLPRVLDDAGITTPVTFREISGSDEAERERFLGSPTIRVDGRDIRSPEPKNAPTTGSSAASTVPPGV